MRLAGGARFAYVIGFFVGVLASLLLVTPGVAAAVGPDPSLCSMSVARGAIPSSFAADACFNGTTLTIHNSLSVAMSVATRGAVGTPTRTETDYGVAAEATRAVSADPRILLPGDTLRFPVGRGPAEFRLIGGKYGGFYELASAVAMFLPGSASGQIQAVAGLIKEINDDFEKYHECDDMAHRNVLRKVGCHAVLARDVAFAIGRAAINGLPSAAAAPIVSSVSFGHWLNASVGDLGALVHSGAIRLSPTAGAASFSVLARTTTSTLTVTPGGRIGALHLGSSTHASVVAALGAPEGEAEGSSADPNEPDFLGLGYECAQQPNGGLEPIASQGPPYCHTVYYLDTATGVLGGFWTVSSRYATGHGTRVDMSGNLASAREHRQAIIGCQPGISELSHDTLLFISVIGGKFKPTDKDPGRLVGGHVNRISIEDRHDPVGILFC